MSETTLTAFRSIKGIIFRPDDEIVSDNGTPGVVTLIMPFGVYVIFEGNKDGIYIEGALGIRPKLKEKTVSEFKLDDLVYMIGRDNKPSYGTVFTIVGLSEDGGRADLRYDGVRYMSCVETKNLTPFVEGLKSKLAKQIGAEPKFRIGDKVRTVVGTVERVEDRNRTFANISVRFPTDQEDGTFPLFFDLAALELVERPKPEPKFEVNDLVLAPYDGIIDREFVVWSRQYLNNRWIYTLDAALLGDRDRPVYYESEMKKAPKPEPKLGSVWLHVGVDRYIYVGHDRFFPANKGSANRSYPRSDFGDKFVEVK